MTYRDNLPVTSCYNNCPPNYTVKETATVVNNSFTSTKHKANDVTIHSTIRANNTVQKIPAIPNTFVTSTTNKKMMLLSTVLFEEIIKLAIQIPAQIHVLQAL